MAVYTRGKKKIYWVRFTAPNGEVVRESTGTPDKRSAEEYEAQYKTRLWREIKLGEVNKTFGEAAVVWLQQKTRDAPERYRVHILLTRFGINTYLRDITPDNAREHLADKSGSTRNRYLNQLTAILNIARKLEWIEKVPEFLRAPIAPNRARWLTKDEWERLQGVLEQSAPHLLELARFSIYTGVRENNALGLEWSQIDMANSQAWLHPDTTKAGKGLAVPLSKDALAVLHRQQGEHARWVFPYGDKPLVRTSNHGWKSARVAAGLEDICWHDLRHTWASWHVQSGTPLNVLQELGGWADYKMVLRYAHLAPSSLRKYIA